MRTLSPDLPEPGVGDMRGWGLYFIKHLVDIFEIKHLPEGGNQVLMVNYLRHDSDLLEYGYEEPDSESYKNTKNTNGNL
jgi:hypothetical protein